VSEAGQRGRHLHWVSGRECVPKTNRSQWTAGGPHEKHKNTKTKAKSERVKERVNDVAESFDSFEVRSSTFTFLHSFALWRFYTFSMFSAVAEGDSENENGQRKVRRERTKRRKGEKEESEKLRN